MAKWRPRDIKREGAEWDSACHNALDVVGVLLPEPLAGGRRCPVCSTSHVIWDLPYHSRKGMALPQVHIARGGHLKCRIMCFCFRDCLNQLDAYVLYKLTAILTAMGLVRIIFFLLNLENYVGDLWATSFQGFLWRENAALGVDMLSNSHKGMRCCSCGYASWTVAAARLYPGLFFVCGIARKNASLGLPNGALEKKQAQMDSCFWHSRVSRWKSSLSHTGKDRRNVKWLSAPASISI